MGGRHDKQAGPHFRQPEQSSGHVQLRRGQRRPVSQSPRRPGDYDGDRKADLGVFEPATATWQIQYSKTNVTSSFVYGLPTIDRFVVGDFDGDLKEDIATFRTMGHGASNARVTAWR